jgi:hypothetical protein
MPDEALTRTNDKDLTEIPTEIIRGDGGRPDTFPRMPGLVSIVSVEGRGEDITATSRFPTSRGPGTRHATGVVIGRAGYGPDVEGPVSEWSREYGAGETKILNNR